MLSKSLLKSTALSLSLISSIGLVAQPNAGTRIHAPQQQVANDKSSEAIPQGCRESVEQVAIDCLQMVDKYEWAMAEQDIYTQSLEGEVETLLGEQRTLIKQNQELRSSRDAWYRDPIIMIGIGIVAGFATSKAID